MIKVHFKLILRCPKMVTVVVQPKWYYARLNTWKTDVCDLVNLSPIFSGMPWGLGKTEQIVPRHVTLLTGRLCSPR